MTYKAAIIGAGRIGAFLDGPQSRQILTHAHGYKASANFEIVGFVDKDLTKAKDAAKCWGGYAFASIERLFAEQKVDVVSVCVPDQVHCETLLTLAKSPVTLIFLEKPPVTTTAEADVVSALYAGLSTKVLVNYTRRFVPEIQKTRELIQSGAYGDFLAGTGYYGKGLLHNGSHMIDLLRFLLGEIGEAKRIEETRDNYDDDPSVTALLSLRSGGLFYLRHIDCRKFDVFELDLTFEKKRIRICELGTVMEEYSIRDSDLFKGYRTMSKDAEYPTQHSKAMSYAVAHIHNILERDETPACTLSDAIETVKTCLRI